MYEKYSTFLAEASFFPEEFLLDLRKDLERGKSSSNYNQVVLTDFDPAVIQSISTVMNEFREPGLAKLEKRYAESASADALDIGPEVISSIKGTLLTVD